MRIHNNSNVNFKAKGSELYIDRFGAIFLRKSGNKPYINIGDKFVIFKPDNFIMSTALDEPRSGRLISAVDPEHSKDVYVVGQHLVFNDTNERFISKIDDEQQIFSLSDYENFIKDFEETYSSTVAKAKEYLTSIRERIPEKQK